MTLTHLMPVIALFESVLLTSETVSILFIAQFIA
jgi:hypothetical protein